LGYHLKFLAKKLFYFITYFTAESFNKIFGSNIDGMEFVRVTMPMVFNEFSWDGSIFRIPFIKFILWNVVHVKIKYLGGLMW
jgi:hypothetical protein